MKQRFSWKIMLAVTLVVMLIVAGCASNNNGSDQPSNSKGNNENASTNKDAGNEGTEERGKISSAIYDRGSVPAEEGTTVDNRWTKWLVEQGPVDVDFVTIPRWEYKEKYNVLFASGDAPDLIFEYDTKYRNILISQKQLMPLNDLIEEHSVEYKALLEKYPILRKVATREDGNMYEFGRLMGLRTNHMLFVRKDWLDNLGLSVPTTTDELYEVAEAFVNDDPDQNGQKDTLAMGVSFVGDNILKQMFQSVNYKIENGTIVRTWDNLTAKDSFVKKMYDNNLVDKDFITEMDTGEKSKQDFISGKLGFYGANGGEAYTIFEALKKNVPDAKVMAIPLPASEFGQFGPVISNPVQGTAAINTNAKDPVAVMKYVDFLVRESTMKTLNYGIEGEHYQVNDKGCPVPIDAEKNKQELSWNGDMKMLVSSALFGECGHVKNTYDPNDPIQKEYLEIIEQSDAAYLNPDTPLAELTHGEHMPTLPEDLQLIVTNTEEQLKAFSQQGVLGGSKYTVEQATADAKAYWEKAGGAKVDEWYANWYETRGDEAILAKDLYEIKID